MSDLDDVFENYRKLNAAGESWENLARRADTVNDRRLAAHLRAQDAGEAPDAHTEPPQARTAGNRAVTVQEAADAQTAATPEEMTAELAAEGGEK